MSPRIKSASVFTDPAFPLACVRMDDHKECGIHSHEFHEIVVLLSGRGRHITDREEYAIEAGDAFLMRGNMAHGYTGTDRMTLVNILFDPKGLRLPMPLLQDLPGYHALFRVEPRLRAYNRFKNRLHMKEEDLAEAAGMIARLQQELERKTPGYRFQASAHLMSLIAFLSRCYSHSERHMDRPLLQMGEILCFIEQHYRENITVGQLTRLAHMSESSLMRTFKRVMGRSPIEHVIRVRVLKAAERLQHGDLRVTEAAFESGFSDSNYFSRQFKKIVGITPREHRLRYRPPARHGSATV